MTDAELKSCPFCGSHAVIKESNAKCGGYVIKCDDFDCQTIKTGSTKSACLRAWNSRATNRLAEQGLKMREALENGDIIEGVVNRVLQGFSSDAISKESVARVAIDLFVHEIRKVLSCQTDGEG